MNFFDVELTLDDGKLLAVGDGIRLKLPPAVSPQLGAHVGKKVIMGVRPEDFHIATDSDSADLNLDVVVEVVERLGSLILLDVSVGQATMVAAVEPTVVAAMHDHLKLALNPNRINFFDASTEAAI